MGYKMGVSGDSRVPESIFRDGVSYFNVCSRRKAESPKFLGPLVHLMFLIYCSLSPLLFYSKSR